MDARLSFLGANGTVTGSRYLVETDQHRLLIDCGLFQGYKQLRLRNWAPPPFDPADIDALVLTHAHIDHSGYLPRLAQLGYSGPVYATPGTCELCMILLPDAGHIQEEDARRAESHGYSKHHPALPLYTEADAMQSLELLRPVDFDQDFEPVAGVRCRLHRAGHLLGAASVQLTVGGRSVLFSGDLGRPQDSIMLPPVPPPAVDVLVVESTYGNRRHRQSSADDDLAPIISSVAAAGGVVVIPTFAVGRAQALLLILGRLRVAGRIPLDLPIYLDSPMAIDATQLYLDHRAEHRLSEADCALIRATAKLVRTRDESRALMQSHGPKVILAASGMVTGGRVLHHLKAFAPDARNAIVLSGYQAGGTRGALIARGDPSVRIHGEDVPIRASVHQLESASAHADADEVLAWMKSAPRAPEQVYVTHGEPDAADALRRRIEHELGWTATVPEFRDVVPL